MHDASLTPSITPRSGNTGTASKEAAAARHAELAPRFTDMVDGPTVQSAAPELSAAPATVPVPPPLDQRTAADPALRTGYGTPARGPVPAVAPSRPGMGQGVDIRTEPLPRSALLVDATSSEQAASSAIARQPVLAVQEIAGLALQKGAADRTTSPRTADHAVILAETSATPPDRHPVVGDPAAAFPEGGPRHAAPELSTTIRLQTHQGAPHDRHAMNGPASAIASEAGQPMPFSPAHAQAQDAVYFTRPTTPAQPTDTAPSALAQVRTAIEQRGQSSTVEVRLDPPELGRIQIDFEMTRNGQVRAVISAAEPETLDLLRRQGHVLSDDLRQSGFGDITLSWGDTAQDRSRKTRELSGWHAVSATILPVIPQTERHDGELDMTL